MAELTCTSLLCNDNIITIITPQGRREIKYKNLSAIRTWDILEKYNKIILPIAAESKKNKDIKKTDEEKLQEVLYGDMKETKRTTLKLVDLCLEIIRPVGLFNQLKARIKGEWLSKKWILDNFDAEEVGQFLQLVLKPLTGEKKTIAVKQ